MAEWNQSTCWMMMKFVMKCWISCSSQHCNMLWAMLLKNCVWGFEKWHICDVYMWLTVHWMLKFGLSHYNNVYNSYFYISKLLTNKTFIKPITNNFYFDLMAELMAEDFVLPEGVLDYKAGWCLALATSMTFTCLIPTDSTWSEEEFLYIQLFWQSLF